MIVKAINQDEFRDFSFVNPDWKPEPKIETPTFSSNNTNSSSSINNIIINNNNLNQVGNLLTPSISFPQPLNSISIITSPSTSSLLSSTNVINLTRHSSNTSINNLHSPTHNEKKLDNNNNKNLQNTEI